MFKFNLGQLVYYIENNRIYSAEIASRRYIDNTEFIKSNSNLSFGIDCIQYKTRHGTYNEIDIFVSVEELVQKLVANMR